MKLIELVGYSEQKFAINPDKVIAISEYEGNSEWTVIFYAEDDSYFVVKESFSEVKLKLEEQ